MQTEISENNVRQADGETPSKPVMNRRLHLVVDMMLEKIDSSDESLTPLINSITKIRQSATYAPEEMIKYWWDRTQELLLSQFPDPKKLNNWQTEIIEIFTNKNPASYDAYIDNIIDKQSVFYNKEKYQLGDRIIIKRDPYILTYLKDSQEDKDVFHAVSECYESKRKEITFMYNKSKHPDWLHDSVLILNMNGLNQHDCINHPWYIEINDKKDSICICKDEERGGKVANMMGFETEILTFRRKIEIIYILASSLHFAHQKRIFHNNLSLNSISITDQGFVYLEGFTSGIFYVEDSRETKMLHTSEAFQDREFIDPQIGKKDIFSPANDIYSFGSLICKLLTRCSIEDFKSERKISIAKKLKNLVTFKSKKTKVHEILEKIIIDCTHDNKSKRITSLNSVLYDLEPLMPNPVPLSIDAWLDYHSTIAHYLNSGRLNLPYVSLSRKEKLGSRMAWDAWSDINICLRMDKLDKKRKTKK